MTIKQRRIIFALCFLFFIIATPIIILYVLGYRWDNGLKFYKTGGLYIYSPVSGVDIFVNDKIQDKTGILKDDVFLQGLLPGRYSILATRDGYWPWKKNLMVKEEAVTEASLFILPTDPQGRLILNENFSPLKNSDYDLILKNLKSISQPPAKNLTEEEKMAFYTRFSSNKKEKIWWDPEKNIIWAEWLDNPLSLPYFFCDDQKCDLILKIYSTNRRIKNIDFYPRRKDVIIFSVDNGIYAIEIDGRGGRNIQPIYKGKDPTFIVSPNNNFFSDKIIYVLDDKNLIEITLP